MNLAATRALRPAQLEVLSAFRPHSSAIASGLQPTSAARRRSDQQQLTKKLDAKEHRDGINNCDDWNHVDLLSEKESVSNGLLVLGAPAAPFVVMTASFTLSRHRLSAAMVTGLSQHDEAEAWIYKPNAIQTISRHNPKAASTHEPVNTIEHAPFKFGFNYSHSRHDRRT